MSDHLQLIKKGAHSIFLMEEKKPNIRETLNTQPIHNGLWTLFSGPLHNSKECCHMVLKCHINLYDIKLV
jgi:hypothetical protein